MIRDVSGQGYHQLPDGTWQKNPTGTEYEPKPVQAWYMRDNHTFRALPLDVEAALAVMREERDAGNTYGMLCGRPEGVVTGVVHARAAAEWQAFEDAARPWLETAVARSKPQAYADERLARAVVAERERIALEFDRRAAPGVGFYEPHEPAAIIRALGPNATGNAPAARAQEKT